MSCRLGRPCPGPPAAHPRLELAQHGPAPSERTGTVTRHRHIDWKPTVILIGVILFISLCEGLFGGPIQ